MTPPVLLVCHSTRPRGGLVHTLSLGEALLAQGVDVRLVAIGDPAAGLFRPTPLPHTIVPSPPPGETLEERVFAAVDALEAGLSLLCPPGPVVLHAQDCIAARAACRIRDGHALTGPRPGGTFVVRTVHHVDDFTTPALIECQRRAILDPDRVLVVSEHWRTLLAEGYGVDAGVVRNGVDPDRFGQGDAGERERFRARAGADENTFLILTVGGIEPRKGSVTLLEAMAELAARESEATALAPGRSSPSSAATPSSTTGPTATTPWPACPNSGSSKVATSSCSARSAKPTSAPGTGRPTPSPSRRSRRGSASSCWKPWPPACRWWPATSRSSPNTCETGRTRCSFRPATPPPLREPCTAWPGTRPCAARSPPAGSR